MPARRCTWLLCFPLNKDGFRRPGFSRCQRELSGDLSEWIRDRFVNAMAYGRQQSYVIELECNPCVCVLLSAVKATKTGNT